MDQLELKASKRDVLGKKVRFLRRQGITPVNVFGHGIESAALQCDTKLLTGIINKAGSTRIINLKLDKSKDARNVMVRDVSRDPLTGRLLHVDLYQVLMTEKIKVEIPIEITGEAPALKNKENMLMQPVHSISVECLPSQIPEHIEVDISPLAELDQAITVRDLKLGEGVAALADEDLVIIKISVRPKEKIEKPVEAVAAAVPEGEAAAEEAAAAPEAEKKEEEKKGE